MDDGTELCDIVPPMAMWFETFEKRLGELEMQSGALGSFSIFGARWRLVSIWRLSWRNRLINRIQGLRFRTWEICVTPFNYGWSI